VFLREFFERFKRGGQNHYLTVVQCIRIRCVSVVTNTKQSNNVISSKPVNGSVVHFKESYEVLLYFIMKKYNIYCFLRSISLYMDAFYFLCFFISVLIYVYRTDMRFCWRGICSLYYHLVIINIY